MSSVVGYDVLVGTCCFEGMWCLHLQGQATQEENAGMYWCIIQVLVMGITSFRGSW